VRVGRHPIVRRQGCDPEKQGGQNQRHARHCNGGIFGLGTSECRNAVRNHLHAGDRCAPCGEGAEYQKYGQTFQRRGRTAGVRDYSFGSLSPKNLHRAGAQHEKQCANGDIRGNGKDPARFTGSSEIDDHDQKDRQQSERDTIREQGREGRGERGNSSGRTHRHGEHVVDHEDGGSGQSGQLAKVGLGHGIGPASFWIFKNDLAVGDGEKRQQQDDHDAHGNGPGHGSGARYHQDQQDFFCGVRDRGKGIGGKDSEGKTL